MKKNIFLFFCGLVLYATILNAQPEKHHWISASPGLRLGGLSMGGYAAELRYEYMLNTSFSVSTYVYYEMSHGIGATGRWYPFSKTFFLELGLGYNNFFGNSYEFDHDTEQWYKYNFSYNGMDIMPGFGWKIDFGKPGGLFITPSIKSPIVFRWFKNPHTPDPHIGIIIIGYFSLGYAF